MHGAAPIAPEAAMAKPAHSYPPLPGFGNDLVDGLERKLVVVAGAVDGAEKGLAAVGEEPQGVELGLLGLVQERGDARKGAGSLLHDEPPVPTCAMAKRGERGDRWCSRQRVFPTGIARSRRYDAPERAYCSHFSSTKSMPWARMNEEMGGACPRARPKTPMASTAARRMSNAPVFSRGSEAIRLSCACDRAGPEIPWAQQAQHLPAAAAAYKSIYFPWWSSGWHILQRSTPCSHLPTSPRRSARWAFCDQTPGGASWWPLQPGPKAAAAHLLVLAVLLVLQLGVRVVELVLEFVRVPLESFRLLAAVGRQGGLSSGAFARPRVRPAEE